MRKWTMSVLLVVGATLVSADPAVADNVYIDDGGYYLVDDNEYQGDIVYLDKNIVNDPGTQLELSDGGSIYVLNLYHNSTVTVTGGSVDVSIMTQDNARVTVTGGLIGGNLSVQGNSRAVVSDGLITGEIQAWDNAIVTVSGGEVGDDLQLFDNSNITVTDISIGSELYAGGASYISVSGGTVAGGIYAGLQPALRNGDVWDTSRIVFVGTNFAIDGEKVNYGDLASDYATAETDPWGYACLTGTLTGTLANGNTLNNTFRIYDEADISFIPEPATLSLLLLGGLALLRRRRSV